MCYKRFFCLLLIFSMLFYFVGCGSEKTAAEVVNLSENTVPIEVKRQKLSDDFVSAQQDFALKVFAAESKKHQGNLSISPYSLSFALGLVAGGAEGETLSQFEEVLMNGLSREEWNSNMYSYFRLSENDSCFRQADSLWIPNNGVEVKDTFLQNVLGNFGASVYRVNFHSEEAVNEVNNWVKDKTEGKIQSIVDEFDITTAMYVADAVYIDINWDSTHREYDVKKEKFTGISGKKNTVKMMYSTLSADKQSYIRDENAEGFIKNCTGDYKFVALMPDKSVNINDYISSLDVNRLRNIMVNAQKINLKTGMPYFTVENNIDFGEVLTEMGIKNAYNASVADFSGISYINNTLYIGKTTQKNYINVDISGIRASSATGHEMVYMSSVPTMEKTVVLNRPFVYIIMDKYNIPVFIGVVIEL